jgi:hypothetical protein
MVSAIVGAGMLPLSGGGEPSRCRPIGRCITAQPPARWRAGPFPALRREPGAERSYESSPTARWRAAREVVGQGGRPRRRTLKGKKPRKEAHDHTGNGEVAGRLDGGERLR